MRSRVMRLFVSIVTVVSIVAGTSFTSFAKNIDIPRSEFDDNVEDLADLDELLIMEFVSAYGLLDWAEANGYTAKLVKDPDGEYYYVDVYIPDCRNTVTVTVDDPISEGIKNTKEAAKKGAVSEFFSGENWWDGIKEGAKEAADNDEGFGGIVTGSILGGLQNASKKALGGALKEGGKSAFKEAQKVGEAKNNGTTKTKQEYAKRLNRYCFFTDTEDERAGMLYKYEILNNRKDIIDGYYNGFDYSGYHVKGLEDVKILYNGVNLYMIEPIILKSGSAPIYSSSNVDVVNTVYIKEIQKHSYNINVFFEKD